MPAKMDFKGLSTSEIRKLHDQTTKLYVQQRDKAARQVTSKPGTDDGWGAHSLPGGGVCTCDNPKSHFAPLENERYYQ